MQNEVIGLLTFRGDTVNGQEVSGFAFVVPSNTVQEYVKAAGATNEQGPTDQLFQEGLELLLERPILVGHSQVRRSQETVSATLGSRQADPEQPASEGRRT